MSVIFYILLLCGLICSSCGVSFARDKFLVKFFQGVTFLFLFLPAAFRYGIGTDYFNYVEIFNKISRGYVLNIEPGWWILNRCVYTLGGNAQTLIALTAFLTYFFLLCEVESEKWFIYVPAFFLIFYTWTFTTLRQMLAMSMCFFALCRIKKGKYFFAILIAGLSFFIHKSVLLYPFIYGLVKIFRFSKTGGLVFISFTCIVSIALAPLLNDIFLYLISFTMYAGYAESTWANAPEVTTGLGRILRFCIYFAFVIFFPKNREKSKLFTLLLLYITLDFFSQIVLILFRIYRGIIVLFLPLAWGIYENKKKHDVPFFIYCCGYLLLFFLDLYGGFHGSVPYLSIFSNF